MKRMEKEKKHKMTAIPPLAFQERESMSRTVGWTMMEEKGPKESAADATAFLPGIFKAGLKMSITQTQTMGLFDHGISLLHIDTFEKSKGNLVLI